MSLIDDFNSETDGHQLQFMFVPDPKCRDRSPRASCGPPVVGLWREGEADAS